MNLGAWGDSNLYPSDSVLLGYPSLILLNATRSKYQVWRYVILISNASFKHKLEAIIRFTLLCPETASKNADCLNKLCNYDVFLTTNCLPSVLAIQNSGAP